MRKFIVKHIQRHFPLKYLLLGSFLQVLFVYAFIFLLFYLFIDYKYSEFMVLVIVLGFTIFLSFYRRPGAISIDDHSIILTRKWPTKQIHIDKKEIKFIRKQGVFRILIPNVRYKFNIFLANGFRYLVYVDDTTAKGIWNILQSLHYLDIQVDHSWSNKSKASVKLEKDLPRFTAKVMAIMFVLLIVILIILNFLFKFI